MKLPFRKSRCHSGLQLHQQISYLRNQRLEEFIGQSKRLDLQLQMHVKSTEKGEGREKGVSWSIQRKTHEVLIQLISLTCYFPTRHLVIMSYECEQEDPQERCPAFPWHGSFLIGGKQGQYVWSVASALSTQPGTAVGFICASWTESTQSQFTCHQ